ncbi:MAG: GGDEF domain-containing protein [Treponema sp.]|nr:GGDEF domain-containing protein [Treponema sp.]
MEFSFSVTRLIFQTYFAPLISISILITFIKANISFTDNINRCFLCACAAAILLTISDSMRFISAHMESPTIYRYISAGVGYSLRTLILYLTSVIAGRNEKKINLLYCIPLAACIITSIISIFPFGKGLMFSFTESNKFIRGPLGFLPHFACIFYTGQIIFYSARNFHHNKFEPIVVSLMAAAAFFAMILENRYHFDFILSQVLIISIIFYFFFLLTYTYKHDTLTDFLSRRCFYLELKHFTKEPLIILSMDLNNLKVYNDTKGHAAGDKAIVTVTVEMRKHFSKHAKLYRTGGDEFMAVFKKTSIQTVEELIKEFQEALSKTEYSVACGFAQYVPGDNVEKIISMSDEKMYANKAKMKGL